MKELLFGRGGSADVIVSVTAVEFRFWVVVLTKKLMFDKTYKKIGVAGSHFRDRSWTLSGGEIKRTWHHSLSRLGEALP